MCCKTFETLLGTGCVPQSVNVCASPFNVSFTFSLLAYLKVLMLECLHFSHTTGSPHYDGWMTLRLGCC